MLRLVSGARLPAKVILQCCGISRESRFCDNGVSNSDKVHLTCFGMCA